jgi:hypothetical protein
LLALLGAHPKLHVSRVRVKCNFIFVSMPHVSVLILFMIMPQLIINTYVSLLCELKNLERYLRVNLLGPGPRLMKKEFTGPRSHEG